MLILHLIETLDIGGAELILVQTANDSFNQGHQVEVCVLERIGEMSELLDKHISVHDLKGRNKYDLLTYVRFIRMIKKCQPDIIHAHSRIALQFLLQIRLINGPVRSAKIVFHEHSGEIYHDPSIPLWFRLLASRGIDYYIGVFEPLKEWAIRAGIREDRIAIIRNAIHLSEPVVRNEGSWRDGVQIGIFVGGIRHDKGLHVLIEAVNQLREHDINFWIVGGIRDPKYYEKCLMRIHELGLEDYFTLMGQRKQARDLFDQVGFGVIPSVSESGPIVLIEYLAASLPVVYTHIGEIGTMVAEAGILGDINSNSVSELVDEIIKLTQLSPNQIAERGKAGQILAYQNFDVEKSFKKIREIYEKVINR